MERLSPAEIAAGHARVKLLFEQITAAWPKYEKRFPEVDGESCEQKRTLYSDLKQARDRRDERV